MAGTGERDLMSDDDSSPAMAGGLSWCWDLDMNVVLEALNGPAPWLRASDVDGPGAGQNPAAGHDPTADHGASAQQRADADQKAASSDDPTADEEEFWAAVDSGRARELPLSFVAGRVAESLPTGPGLAGWLAQSQAAALEDGALAGIAESFRRLASWATAGELATLAQIASRSARADRRASIDAQGRPDRITTDAAGQVALALTMSQDGATAWTDLGVTLAWRLPATGSALAAGEIDVSRARMIARMTGPLSDEAAHQVEQSVLERAGMLTLGQLHDALRRAVIKVDPDGAERRREEAERKAKVVLYPEDEGTATLAGYALPGAKAAAAMARITALARARKAAGAAGRIDLLRAQVYLGLLLGTLPYIPPAPSAPPDVPPDRDSPDRDSPDGNPPGEHSPEGAPPAQDRPSATEEPQIDGLPEDEPPLREPPEEEPPAQDTPDEEEAGDPGPGEPADDDDPDDLLQGPVEPWPEVLPFVPPEPPSRADGLPDGPAAAQRAGGGGRLLSLAVPFTTLAGTSASPGRLSRLGVITASQARYLAARAARDPGCQWRVVVTTPAGHAIAITHVPLPRVGPSVIPSDRPPSDAVQASQVGFISRVTLTVSTDLPGHDPPDVGGPPGTGAGAPLARLLRSALAAARRAAARAAEQARADQEAGGCAHTTASAAYRPPPRIRELVIARDVTCRFAPCGRPATQCDLDHTIPFDQGGLTCRCNLGGECRLHHKLKQLPGWALTQPSPGVFRWTTPTGRSYIVRPDAYPL